MKKSRILKLLSLVMTLTMIVSFSTFEVSATAGVSYSMGGEFHNGDDIRSAANYFALCGYKSYWNDEVDMAYLNSATRLNSDVVYFSAHGSQDRIKLPDVYLGDQYAPQNSVTAVINNFYPLSNAKLYIYDACSTASNEDGTNINLCSETLASGVDTVIGWTDSIGSGDAYKWQQRFQNRLALGHSVSSSASYANGFSDYNNNTTIKSYRIYGNGSLIIKKSKGTNSDIPIEARDYTELKSMNISVDVEQNQPAIQAIKQIAPDFSAENYVVKTTQTSYSEENYTIDYLEKKGDYITSSGYSIIVEKGVVVGVQNNTVSSSVKVLANSVPVITQNDINNANEVATQMVFDKNENYVVDELSGEAFYDVENNKYYYRVFVVYETPDDVYGAFSYLHPIS